MRTFLQYLVEQVPPGGPPPGPPGGPPPGMGGGGPPGDLGGMLPPMGGGPPPGMMGGGPPGLGGPPGMGGPPMGGPGMGGPPQTIQIQPRTIWDLWSKMFKSANEDKPSANSNQETNPKKSLLSVNV